MRQPLPVVADRPAMEVEILAPVSSAFAGTTTLGAGTAPSPASEATPEPAAFHFLPLGFAPGIARLRCLRPLPGPATLLLYCRGIEIGRLALDAPPAAGAVVELPVTRLPCVRLPAELRLATAVDGPDLAPPWRLDHAAQALDLLGPPAPSVEELRLEAGVLRGVLVERRNGLLEPVLYARINEAGARAVAVEPPVALPEGGCVARFGVALTAADLLESGLAVTLHLIGLEAPLARYVWRRAEPSERTLAALEGRLGRLEQAGAAGLEAAQAELRRQLAVQQERIDAFVEAAAALLLDRLAGTAGAAEAPAALRDLIAAAAPVLPPAPAPPAARIELPPDAGHFGFGWHDPEHDAEGAFRWMSGTGLIINPEPGRPVAAVILALAHVHGAADATAALQASLDGQPLVAAAEQGGEPGGRAAGRIRLVPADGPVTGGALRLDAGFGGAPAEPGTGGDTRHLSLAVAGITFDYA